MFNILSYVGLNLQSELCLWTLVGLLRTIFDATLFKVNANLKQVWQMRMPPELSKSVQRGLRTMISGVMLVQCFTVYVYLASYIVLLYPVFLEERPTLVLPWLLLAAVRKFLCELTSLALGLGACLLLGPGRPPCVKFVVFKVASITPAVYMWMLVYSYYNTLKLSSTFKTLSTAMQSNDQDFGLELAVRRRRTKSLLGENQLRERLVANFNYGERNIYTSDIISKKPGLSSNMIHATNTNEDTKEDSDGPNQYNPNIAAERLMSDLGEDWGGAEIVPRDGDRILEQLVLMLLRIGEYKRSDATDPEKLFSSNSRVLLPYNNMDCTSIHEDTDTPPLVGSSKGKTASYLEEYPQIFMKKNSEIIQRQNESQFSTLRTVHSQVQMDDQNNGNKSITYEKIFSKDVNRKKVFQLSSESNTVNNKCQGEIRENSHPNRKEVDLQTRVLSENGNELVEMIVKTPSVNSFQIEVGNKSGEVSDLKNMPKNEKQGSVSDVKLKTESINSLQSIIDRMRKSLPLNGKSEQCENVIETNRATTNPGIKEENTSHTGVHKHHSQCDRSDTTKK